jgi:hypothetical protein
MSRDAEVDACFLCDTADLLGVAMNRKNLCNLLHTNFSHLEINFVKAGTFCPEE